MPQSRRPSAVRGGHLSAAGFTTPVVYLYLDQLSEWISNFGERQTDTSSPADLTSHGHKPQSIAAA
jgi:hypothetical protein